MSNDGSDTNNMSGGRGFRTVDSVDDSGSDDGGGVNVDCELNAGTSTGEDSRLCRFEGRRLSSAMGSRAEP